MAIHNPARIPVVAELRRQKLFAEARHERLCRSARIDAGAVPSLSPRTPQPSGTMGALPARPGRAFLWKRRTAPALRAAAASAPGATVGEPGEAHLAPRPGSVAGHL